MRNCDSVTVVLRSHPIKVMPIPKFLPLMLVPIMSFVLFFIFKKFDKLKFSFTGCQRNDIGPDVRERRKTGWMEKMIHRELSINRNQK